MKDDQLTPVPGSDARGRDRKGEGPPEVKLSGGGHQEISRGRKNPFSQIDFQIGY